MKIKLFTILTFTLLFFACSDHSSKDNNEATEEVKNVIVEQTDNVNEDVSEIINDDQLNDSSAIVEEEIQIEKPGIVDENMSNTTEEDNSKSSQSNATTPKDEVKIIETVVETIKEEVAKPNHTVWNDLLKKYVSSTGKVNYKGLKNEKSKIENYINQLTGFTTQTDWSRNEKLAYWINLYNATTVKLILDHYPLKSITDLYGGKPWDKKLVTIGSKSYSLNKIENDIIRPKFNDARIHFAVNCAAKSCPKLMNSAFMPDKLNYQLNKQAKAFINSSKNNISPDAITISKIFEWYKDDFKHGDVIAFLNQYSNTKINPNASINYNEYDWNLNE